MDTPASGKIETLWEVLDAHARSRPDAIALEFEGSRHTYAQLSQSSIRLAGELIHKGVRHGDRIAYLGKNNDRYFVLLYAVARLGAVLVPLNWRLAQEEWLYILRDAQPVLLFADEDFSVAGLAQVFPGLPPSLMLASALAAAAPEHSVPFAKNGGEAVLQIYTSGTTGTPKGAMLTHGNLLALRRLGYAAGLAWFPGPDDTSLVVLPVAHIAGTAYALFGFYGGGRVVVMREFDAEQMLRTIGSERVTHVLLAPAAMRQLLDHPDSAHTDFSRLRYITYGASPIPEALLRRALALFDCEFVQMYGMTEAAGGVVALSPEDHRSHDANRLQSAGRAMPGVEIGIVDDQGRMLEAGSTGEIVVRSAAVMAGYWRRPEATAEVMMTDGWLRTGDIGRLDAQGYLFVLDRAKDMIVSGGENIYPAEVENAIFGHPDVADVAVIGVPSERWGEEVMAMIVPRADKTPDLASITRWARARIAGFKVPRQICLVPELPRNAGNKVLRRLLRKPYWDGLQRQIN